LQAKSSADTDSHPTVRGSFDAKAAGNPPSVPDSDGVFPDDVPVADALEQQQPAADPPDEGPDGGVPLEAGASDWQEQRETVPIDPDLEEPDRRE
jgi:hypothetical protein